MIEILWKMDRTQSQQGSANEEANQGLLPNVEIVEHPVQRELIIDDTDNLEVTDHLRIIGVEGTNFKLISRLEKLGVNSKISW